MSFPLMVEPQLAPRGTSVQSFSASEMEVSWNAIAWNRNTGRVLGYEVIHVDFTLHIYAEAHDTIAFEQVFIKMSFFLSCNSTSVVTLLYTNVSKQLQEYFKRRMWEIGVRRCWREMLFFASTSKDAHGHICKCTYFYTVVYICKNIFYK